MTNEELDRLETLANAATPGPWVFRMSKYGRAHEVWAQAAEYETVMDNEVYYPHGVTSADQEFCAAARDAVPALVAEVRRLRGLVEAAFLEGQESSKTDRDDMAWYWPQSDARKALEGA